MRRAHWLLLATGVLLIVLTTTDWLDAPDDDPLPASLAREPDLYMEDAEIRQYAADGALQYRLDADRIAHFPGRDGTPARTELAVPRLQLERPDGPPWQVRAETGTVTGGGPGTAGGEVVELETAVRLQRHHPDRRFLTLESEALTLYPDREFVTTDRPVIIKSHSGTTTAAAMDGDLAAGLLTLHAAPPTGADPGSSAGRQRVHTVIPPQPIEPERRDDLFPR